MKMDKFVLVLLLIVTSAAGFLFGDSDCPDKCTKQMNRLQTTVNNLDTTVNVHLKQDLVYGFHVIWQLPHYKALNVTPQWPVSFNKVVTNVGGAYSSGEFTVPYSGLYDFQLYFTPPPFADVVNLVIFADSQPICYANARGSRVEEAPGQGSCYALVHLNRGQKVSVRAARPHDQIWTSPWSSFSGKFLHG